MPLSAKEFFKYLKEKNTKDLNKMKGKGKRGAGTGRAGMGKKRGAGAAKKRRGGARFKRKNNKVSHHFIGGKKRKRKHRMNNFGGGKKRSKKPLINERFIKKSPVQLDNSRTLASQALSVAAKSGIIPADRVTRYVNNLKKTT